MTNELKFTYFHDTQLGIKNTKPLKVLSFVDLINTYKSDEVKRLTDQIRSCEDPDEKKELKKGLPLITCHGVFEGGRTLAHLKEHNDKLLVIDIDNLTSEHEARQLQKHFSYFDSCCLSVVSARGKGVKAFFITTTSIRPDENYRYYFLKHNDQQIKDKLKLHRSVILDHAQFNVHQPFFLSHDPLMFYRFNAVPMSFDFTPYTRAKEQDPEQIHELPVISQQAGTRIEKYIRKIAENTAKELEQIGQSKAPRHPNIARIKNVAELLHYAPHLTHELREYLKDAVVCMYGSLDEAKNMNALKSFDSCWGQALEVKRSNNEINKIISIPTPQQ